VHNVLDPDVSPAPEWELFDHANDPLDQLNLADDNPEVVERLGQLLDDWLEFALASQFPEDDVVFEDLDPAELDRLRSLGYIQ